MRILKNKYYTTLFFITFSFFAFSQITTIKVLHPKITKSKANFQLDFTNISTKEGLPISNCYDIIQSKNGNYWVATNLGVCSYDGLKFTPLKQAGESSAWCVFEDRDKNLWIGNNNGAIKYDGLKIIRFNDTANVGKSAVVKIIQSRDGKIWMAGYRVGVICIDNGKVKIYNKCGNKNVKLIFSVYEDKNGLIWIGDKSGVYNIKNNELVAFNQTELLDTKSIFQDYYGNYWFGTNGKGVYKSTNHQLKQFCSENGAIQNNVIWGITEDDEHKVWLSTDYGVSIFDGNNFSTITQNEGLISNRTWSVKKDHLGRMLVASYDMGISIYNGNRFKYLNAITGFTDKPIRYILKDSKNNYWFATTGDGIIMYDGNFYTKFDFQNPALDNLIWTIYEDNDGIIWFGSDAGLIKYSNNTFTRYEIKRDLPGYFIWPVLKDKKGTFWIGTFDKGLFKFNGTNFLSTPMREKLNSNRILQIVEDNLERKWINASSSTNLILPNDTVIKIDTTYGVLTNYVNHIFKDNKGWIWLCSNNGLSVLTNLANLKNWKTIERGKNNIPDISFANIERVTDSTVWLGTNKGVLCLKYKVGINKIEIIQPITFYNQSNGFKEIECSGFSTYETEDNNHWWGTPKGATIISGDKTNKTIPGIEITAIDLFYQTIDWKKNSIKNLKFDSLKAWKKVPDKFNSYYSQNHFTFRFQANNVRNFENVLYQFKLENFDDEWSDASKRNDVTYSNLPPGEYTFKVISINELLLESQPTQISFTILPPYWQTWWFRFFAIFLIVTLVILIFRYRTNSLIKRKKELEEIIDKRTHELKEQKEIAENQKEIVQRKNKEITDSINYAKRIQYTLLANTDFLKKHLPQHFILFKPKDIVSGDFYWATAVGSLELGVQKADIANPEPQTPNSEPGTNNSELFYLAVCDCTGHGVPGAFMSLLNIGFLSEAIREKNIYSPNKIFNYVRSSLIDSISKDEQQDGMDGILLKFNYHANGIKAEYAAAHNHPILIRNNQLIELNKDKMPVGKGEKKDSFNLFSIDLQKNDLLYLFTDGFADQFGGPKGKKFKYKKLIELLLANNKLEMNQQSEILNSTFEEWRGNLEQVDDVLIVGIKI